MQKAERWLGVRCEPMLWIVAFGASASG